MKRCNPIIEHNIAIAVLAAGSGTRFGGGKLDADLAGRPVGRSITDSAEEAGFTRRIIVTPETAPDFVLHLKGWENVVNPAPLEGLASSIRAAVAAVADCDRIVLALADMPLVEHEHLVSLAMTSGIVFTEYPEGKRGVPAAFPSSCFPRLGQLNGAMGAAVADWGADVTALAPSSASSLLDVDSSEDISVIENRLG